MKKKVQVAAKTPRPPLDRIADSLQLLLKLQCMRANLTIGDLRAATLVRVPDQPAVALNQTSQELEELAKTLPGSAEEHDYLTQAMGGAGLKARLEALKGAGGEND